MANNSEDSNHAVDKIRDLIFGTQMDSYNQHFHRLESLIAAASKESSEQINTRIAGLETTFNKRLHRAEEALEQERNQRIEAFNSVNAVVQHHFQQLSQQLHKLEGISSQNMTDLKGLLDQQAHSMSVQLQNLQQQFNQSLNDQAAGQEQQTIKRQKLAELLTELSTQIKHD